MYARQTCLLNQPFFWLLEMLLRRDGAQMSLKGSLWRACDVYLSNDHFQNSSASPIQSRETKKAPNMMVFSLQ
jgi:hypothetical protein